MQSVHEGTISNQTVITRKPKKIEKYYTVGKKTGSETGINSKHQS